MKIALISIIIISIILTLTLGLFVMLLTHNSPYITAPFETANVDWTVFEYEYADDEFNQCISDSLSVYDIAECYQNNNKQLLDKRFNGIDIPTSITVNLYFDKDSNLNYFSIDSPSYFLNIDVFETQNQSIFFSYPEGEYLESSTNKLPVTNIYIGDTKEKFVNDIQAQIQEQKPAVNNLEDGNSVISIPFNSIPQSSELKLLTFDTNNSEDFIDRLSLIY